MAVTKIKLKITGMHCVSCAINIDGELEDTTGVKQSNTNYANQHTEVEFDTDAVTEKKIIDIIMSLGYRVQINK